MARILGFFSALALAHAAQSTEQAAEIHAEKRDCGPAFTLQAAAAPCQPQLQLQAIQPPVQVQPQVQVVPCQQALQPFVVQANQPCAQPIVVQEQYVPPPVIYQQPVYQPQPPPPPIYQPVYQPQPQPQPIYYPQPPPSYDNGGSACYSQIGNGLAGASGRLLRYLLCPWSYFADCCDESDGPEYNYPPAYAPQYAPQYIPQYAPQYVPQYAPQYTPQYSQPIVQAAPQPQIQPQGQWYFNVVPAPANPQNNLLQPVHSSLVPDYGLPSGYVLTANVAPCNNGAEVNVATNPCY